MWYIYPTENYSAKEWNNAIYRNMDGPRVYCTKWSKTEKDKNHIIIYMWNVFLKWYNKLIYKTETDL